jgi:hypothetical protein
MIRQQCEAREDYYLGYRSLERTLEKVTAERDAVAAERDAVTAEKELLVSENKQLLVRIKELEQQNGNS